MLLLTHVVDWAGVIWDSRAPFQVGYHPLTPKFAPVPTSQSMYRTFGANGMTSIMRFRVRSPKAEGFTFVPGAPQDLADANCCT